MYYMGLVEDLTVAAASGAKVVSVTAPERDRFYANLCEFSIEESEADGGAERTILVCASNGV
ncbi:uncharacterized protein METZ01_LOCUS245839, partial [marine metagenome]